jgi:IS30 family transposase
MYIACRQQLLILVERKSRYTKIKSIGTAPPKLITKKTIEAISEVPVPAHTMTNDRGPEFKDSPNLEIPTYFCDIQKPQQKGTVENTIGLLRQYIKRTTTAQSLPEEKLNHIETQLNLRPRKVLDYKTPYEVLFQTKVALAH